MTLLSYFFLIFSPIAIKAESVPTLVIYDGEAGSAPFINASSDCSTYLTEEAGSGRNRSTGIKLTPDKWHTSRYKFFCGGSNPRIDFSAYNYLEFYLRSPDTNPGDRFFWANSYGTSGELISYKLSIKHYIDGGTIDTSWRLVSISINKLQTSSWNLQNVEALLWDVDGSNRLYYIDDIALRREGSPITIVKPTTPAPAPAPAPVDPVIPAEKPAPKPIMAPPKPLGKAGLIIWSGEFVGSPDQWRSPNIDFSGSATSRQDLSRFDEIRFYAKADSAGKTINFSADTFAPTRKLSRVVNIDPYIEGGQLDTDYRLVRIPVKALQTSEYGLQSINNLFFGTAPNGSKPYKIFIKDISGADTTPTTVADYQILSNKVIKLSIKDRYDFDGVLNLSNYALNGVRPVQVGREYHAADFITTEATVVDAFALYLIFAEPLKNGNGYTLTINNVRDDSGQDFPSPVQFAFTYNDLYNTNGSVKVNQVGYLPTSPKFGYIGNYLGDAGAMDINPAVCEIRSADTNAAMFSTAARFRGYDTALSGEKVYDCDFSAFTATGSYYLYVPGVGRTYNFKIGHDVFNDAYQKTARVYYYQRAGLELTPQFAGPWARPAGHGQDAKAEIHSAVRNNSALYGGEQIGSTVNMLGGWYDAGDYGKYMMTAGPALFHLFSSYELYPEKFKDNMYNIPESGNNISDILDEAKWEVDWLKAMQAPDGGVYDRVTTTQWGTDVEPQFDKATRYIAPKTTHATAMYVASLAMAYRNFLPFWPDYAKDLLKRAEKSWSWLQAHPSVSPAEGFINPPGIGGGSYNDSDGDTDGRAWAAAELYKSTGKNNYAADFVSLWTKNAPTAGWNEFQHQQKKASWAYATTKFPTQSAYIESYKSALKRDMDELVSRTNANVYRNAYRSDVPNFIGWGSYAQSTRYSEDLIKAYYLLGDKKYLEAAAINLDTQLGNNPQYLSYITGVGYQYPHDPLHGQSMRDRMADPVPGIPVFGPHNYMSEANGYSAAAQSDKNLYPQQNSYPILRRYYDSHELVEMSEFTIIELAQTVSALAYFSNNVGSTLAPQTAPLIKVTPTPLNLPTPPPAIEVAPAKPVTTTPPPVAPAKTETVAPILPESQPIRLPPSKPAPTLIPAPTQTPPTSVPAIKVTQPAPTPKPIVTTPSPASAPVAPNIWQVEEASAPVYVPVPAPVAPRASAPASAPAATSSPKASSSPASSAPPIAPAPASPPANNQWMIFSAADLTSTPVAMLAVAKKPTSKPKTAVAKKVALPVTRPKVVAKKPAPKPVPPKVVVKKPAKPSPAKAIAKKPVKPASKPVVKKPTPAVAPEWNI